MCNEISRMIINKVGERNNKIREHIEIDSLVKCSLDFLHNTDELPEPDSVLNLRVREGVWPFVFVVSRFAFGTVSCVSDFSDFADSLEGLVSGRFHKEVVDINDGFECDKVHYKVNEVGLSRHEKDCDRFIENGSQNLELSDHERCEELFLYELLWVLCEELQSYEGLGEVIFHG